MKLNEYQRSRSFFDHSKRSLRFQKIKTGFSQKLLGHLKPRFSLKAFGKRGIEVSKNELGHMAKMAAMPIYIENVELLRP